MYGAIPGDMTGAPYEFDRGKKTKDFPLFVKESQFTDDTVMTIAVACALADAEIKLIERDKDEKAEKNHNGDIIRSNGSAACSLRAC